MVCLKEPAPRKKKSVPPARRSPGYVPRPCNKWIIFRNEKQKKVLENLKRDNPDQSNYVGDVSRTTSGMWHSLTPAEKEEYAEKARREATKHKQMHPDYVYRPGDPKNTRKMNSGNGKSVKGKSVENEENEESVPVTEKRLGESSHSKVDCDESNAPEEPTRSVLTTALPSPLQPVEPRMIMNFVQAGNMVKPPPGPKVAGQEVPILNLRNDFSPPKFRVNKTLEASTRGLESKDIAQASRDICFVTTPEGHTVRYGKEAWTGELIEVNVI
ncbi:hypothetical protein PQX77_015123 [Marasmius sp. AFHP31]|nr:hypothetical protein PQX77_015123 [Marasmius sp. AFHP31]